ncbi:hypothetical protein BD408DRAFT_405678 [Parasitella parasitica]|nr:hypothetical protein BD408DRAFT_405678 [Parasitella parasitica]
MVGVVKFEMKVFVVEMKNVEATEFADCRMLGQDGGRGHIRLLDALNREMGAGRAVNVFNGLTGADVAPKIKTSKVSVISSSSISTSTSSRKRLVRDLASEKVKLLKNLSNKVDQLVSQNNFDISHIWTTADAEAITYLGYPLVQSIQQRQSFFTTFIRNLRLATDFHSRRAISLYGRATIVNSLIASKCWSILSVLSVPQAFLNNIRSVIISFINTNITPVLS